MIEDNESIPFDDEPLSLEPEDDKPLNIEPEEEQPLTISGESSGRSISHLSNVGGSAGGGFNFSRPMQQTGKGATRCRIFRSKISVIAIESLEQHINEWLESDDIDVKEVGHLIGTMHGKLDEDNVIVMVWY
ncbi:MAG: hypothetical protein GY794_04935 [bacterium]|nr:hypothetical protein [bacterium]